MKLSGTTMWLLALLALALTGCGERRSQPRLDRVLTASWQSYRQQFISPEGRVRDAGAGRRHHFRGPGLCAAPGRVGRG